MTAPTLHLLSLGAGVQSTALALMAADGDLPNLDGAIFADTGWEPRRVYDVVDQVEQLLTGADIPLHRVSNGNLRGDAIDPVHRYASIPYYVLNWREREEPIRSTAFQCPDCRGFGWPYGNQPRGMAHERAADWLRSLAGDEDVSADLTLLCLACDGWGVRYREFYTVRERVEGMGRRQCTSEYKLAPINRKVRELLGAEAPDYRRVLRGRVAEQWIGFSTDEIGRVSDKDGVSYVRKRYPLIDLGMSRGDCEQYLREKGWAHVAKSACIGCPFHGNAQWRDLRDNHPDEWADAVAFDEAIRKGGARGLPLDGQAFLHRSRAPLALAPIDRPTLTEKVAAQVDLLAELGDPDGCSPYGCRSGAAA